jgi:hypothetical protein
MTELQGPPYDGKACPMCPLPNRVLSAVTFNFVLATVKISPAQFDEGRAIRKLRELQDTVDVYADHEWNDPRLKDLYEAAKFVCKVALPDGKPPLGVPWRRLAPVIEEKLYMASQIVHGLSVSHFANQAHSTKPKDTLRPGG